MIWIGLGAGMVVLVPVLIWEISRVEERTNPLVIIAISICVMACALAGVIVFGYGVDQIAPY